MLWKFPWFSWSIFFKDQKLNKLHNCSISLRALLMFTCRWQYNLKLIWHAVYLQPILKMRFGMHVKCTTSANNFSVISAAFLFLNEHPRLVPQTFSFPHKHIHLLVPEAVGHVMHSLFCALQLLLDRICVVPFKSTQCVLQNSHLKCINQCLGNLFILVLVLGGKFLLFYYKFSLITWNTFFFWCFRKKNADFHVQAPNSDSVSSLQTVFAPLPFHATWPSAPRFF